METTAWGLMPWRSSVSADDKGFPRFRQQGKLLIQRGTGGADCRFPDRRDAPALAFRGGQVADNIGKPAGAEMGLHRIVGGNFFDAPLDRLSRGVEPGDVLFRSGSQGKGPYPAGKGGPVLFKDIVLNGRRSGVHQQGKAAVFQYADIVPATEQFRQPVDVVLKYQHPGSSGPVQRRFRRIAPAEAEEDQKALIPQGRYQPFPLPFGIDN